MWNHHMRKLLPFSLPLVAALLLFVLWNPVPPCSVFTVERHLQKSATLEYTVPPNNLFPLSKNVPRPRSRETSLDRCRTRRQLLLRSSYVTHHLTALLVQRSPDDMSSHLGPQILVTTQTSWACVAWHARAVWRFVFVVGLDAWVFQGEVVYILRSHIHNV